MDRRCFDDFTQAARADNHHTHTHEKKHWPHKKPPIAGSHDRPSRYALRPQHKRNWATGKMEQATTQMEKLEQLETPSGQANIARIE